MEPARTRRLLVAALVCVSGFVQLENAGAQSGSTISGKEVQEIQQRIDRAVEASRAGQHGRAARDLAGLIDSG